MNFDLAKILQSKREFRQRLAARPIAEKLASWTPCANARSPSARRNPRWVQAFT